MGVRLEMRVDMRRWALALCFIGVMGGGCSARSLLTIELSTDDGTAVRGTPLIEVTQGNVIKTVDREDTFIVLEAGKATNVGVYLDGDVSGAVGVNATLRGDTGCDWSGQSDRTVNVRAGQRSNVAVKLKKRGCGGPGPDAGADAGDAAIDAPPTLLGDGGDGTTGPTVDQACTTYCDRYRERCADWGAPQQNFTCFRDCLQWHQKNLSAPDGGGTILSCLDRYVRATENPDAENLCAMCPLASPESEACGLGPARTYACAGDASADGP